MRALVGSRFRQVVRLGKVETLTRISVRVKAFSSLATQAETPEKEEIPRNVKDLIARSVKQPTIQGSATVSEAISHLCNNKCWASLVVDEKNDLIGVYTSGDILNFMHARGMQSRVGKERALEAPIIDAMTPREKIIHCSPSDSIDRCREMMFQLHLKHLPVLDNGEVIGIVSLTDVSNAAFSLSDVGGKKGFIHNVTGRKGIPEGIKPRQISASSPRQNVRLDVEIGAFALPHPFKTQDGVSQNRRAHGPQEYSEDPDISEDSHFVLKVRGRVNETDQVYMGIADGVGSWREHGVDPKNFSRKLIQNASDVIQSDALQRNFTDYRNDDFDTQQLGLTDHGPIHPLDVMMDAWSMTVAADRINGSSTLCIATIDNSLSQLIYSNIGDGGLLVLRHIDIETAGYMRHRDRHRDARSSNLRIAYISQQQLKAFNLPYQLGYSNITGYPGSFESPNDADTASIPVLPGDIIILATDGLFDNMDLHDIIHEATEWEKEYFSASKSTDITQRSKSTQEVRILAERLTKKARELSLDDSRDSPFALLAKENDIMWGGGMPDDTTVVVARVVHK